MSEVWHRYERKWTDLSLKELSNFAKWMNEILGYNPTIIGGWAVYFYNQHGLGSRDIDIVLPTRDIRDKVINMYMASNGYILRERAFGQAEWIKLLETGNPASETYLDVCTLQDRNNVHGKELEIPWSIATKWQRAMPVEEATILVPEPESLLVLKVKAAWDRSYDIASGDSDVFKRDKLRKDRFDILSLLSSCEMREGIISEIVSKHGFAECFGEAVERATSDLDVVARHGFEDGEMTRIKKAVKKITNRI